MNLLQDQWLSVKDLKEMFPLLSDRMIRHHIYKYNIPYQKVGQMMIVHIDDIKILEAKHHEKKLRTLRKDCDNKEEERIR